MNTNVVTWVSDKFSVLASSFRSWPTTYWFFSKACSSLSSWDGEKAVRMRLGFLKGSRNSGRPGGPASGIFSFHRKYEDLNHITLFDGTICINFDLDYTLDNI